jgi:uncharacterized membrane protein YbhN (UPF0104 family)
MKRLRKLIPVVVSVVLLVIIGGYAPWPKVGRILADFDASTVAILLGLSLAYYALKVVRFYYMLEAIGIHQRFKTVALSYMSAQPVSLLPAGEIYRSHTLQRHTGVPLQRSLAQFTMQGILEGSAMAVVGIISALALGKLRLPALLLTLLIVAVVLAVRRGYIANLARLLNAIPFVTVNPFHLLQFSRRNQVMLSRQRFPLLFGLSLAAEVVGTAIAYVSVVGLGGHINLFQAALTYIVPVVVGFASLLPGGLGASEQSAIGVLLLAHTGVALAVAATLIMRIAIVGTGLAYGAIAIALSARKPYKP